MKVDTNGLRARDLPASTITRLLTKYEPVIQAMCYGIDEPTVIEGKRIPAGYGLTLRQAALHNGLKLRQARLIAESPQFATALYNANRARRLAESPTTLQTQIDLRDYKGDQSPARDTVRLKACDAIEGKSSSGTNVNVNVSQSTNLTAGYIIKLPASKPTDPPTIEHHSKPTER
jgi:hypothetical protein